MKSIQKTVALVLGIVLTLVGIAGFFVGDVLLIFGVNTLHNLIHLATGVIGIWAGLSSVAFARGYNKTFGVVYILVFILGLVVPGVLESLINLNAADNILHLVLAVVYAGVGFFVKE